VGTELNGARQGDAFLLLWLTLYGVAKVLGCVSIVVAGGLDGANPLLH